MRSKFEIKAQKELESQGYAVDWKLRPSFKSHAYNTDYFNLFDLLAIRVGDPVRWISVKGKAGVPGHHRKALESFWLPEGNQKEVWMYRKLKGHGNKFIPRKEIIGYDYECMRCDKGMKDREHGLYCPKAVSNHE